ncbi:MAG: SpoVG family protein [Planctomycetota bacterium]|nr:SpoVG family protein [Planctomycetota bacterium]
MKVTEVRIKLTGETSDRLLAFCSVTFDDCFVVRDLKIIDGETGPFLAMPSRKMTASCPECRCKNYLRSHYCTSCGADLRSEPAFQSQDTTSRLYADIAHPVNAECREMLQNSVLEEFNKERECSHLPGYRSRYDDDYDAPGREGLGSRKESRRLRGSVGPKKQRTDEVESNYPPGTHQSPHQPEESSQPDNSDDQFGAGIL